MTIGEAINRVRRLYDEKQETNSLFLPTKFIYSKLLTVREKIILQRKFSSVKSSDLQSIHMIGMTPIYNIDGVRVMKSTSQIPEFIGNRINKSIAISSESGITNYSRTTFEEHKRIAGNKYSKNLPYFYIYDNYIYILNSRAENIVANAIWRDPIVAYRMSLSNQSISTCINNTAINFYTPFAEDIISVTVKELLGPIYQEEKNASLP